MPAGYKDLPAEELWERFSYRVERAEQASVFVGCDYQRETIVLLTYAGEVSLRVDLRADQVVVFMESMVAAARSIAKGPEGGRE